MPAPQKNSGNRGAKNMSGVATKNARFIKEFIDEIRGENDLDDIHVARILQKKGNGRVEAFFVDRKMKPTIVQAIIRGTFSGKGKRSAWIDVNSIVIIANNGISGAAEFSIMAVLSPDQIHDIKKFMPIDSRILALDVSDTSQLMVGNHVETDGGFEFELAEDDIPMNDADIDKI